MKVAVIGGGSTYTPELVDGVGRLAGSGPGALDVTELTLVDPDTDRLAVVGPVSARIMRALGHPGQVTWTDQPGRGPGRGGRGPAPAAGGRAGGPAPGRELAAGLRRGRPGDHRRRRPGQGAAHGAGGAGDRRAGPAAGRTVGLDRGLHQPGRDRDPGPAGRGSPRDRPVQRGHRLPAPVRVAAGRGPRAGGVGSRGAEPPDLGAGRAGGRPGRAAGSAGGAPGRDRRAHRAARRGDPGARDRALLLPALLLGPRCGGGRGADPADPGPGRGRAGARAARPRTPTRRWTPSPRCWASGVAPSTPRPRWRCWPR